MVYFLSFFRRLQLKSSCHFSLPLAILAALIAQSFFWLLIFLPLPFILLAISRLVDIFDRRQRTHIRCRVCSYPHCVILYPRKVRRNKSAQGSYACSSFDHGHYPDIYFCPSCKNGQLESVSGEQSIQTETEGHEFYAAVEDTTYLSNIKSRYATYHKITSLYRPLFENRDILEIGTYYGVFYESVHRVANSYTGIEPSRHACQYITNKYPDIECINDNLERALKEEKLRNKKFDTIVLWDVIEHLPDPITALKQLHDHLKKDGHIIFSTINMEATIALIMGPYWPWFMDMHYYYFSDRGFPKIMQQANFSLEENSHFRYYVHLSYFIDKIKSLFWSKDYSSNRKDDSTSPLIPIQFGDTVLIMGKK